MIEVAANEPLREDPGQRAQSPEHPHTGTRRRREEGPSRPDKLKRPRTDMDTAERSAPVLDRALLTSGAEDAKSIAVKDESDGGEEVEEIEVRVTKTP